MNKIDLPKKISPQRLLWEKVLAMTLLVLLCCFAGAPTFAQTTTVRGKITDHGGQPVAGASVTVKGGGAGTNTGADGSFAIQASKGAILVVTSVTFVTKEVTVGDGNEILNIQLIPASTDLGEVIVVGYGTQRKEAVTGSVASIGGEKMREVPSPNISQALQGRLPGVDIAQTSTRPGSTMQIRIRGTRSLSADNNPLIVLDGIPFIGSLADINPNDIKSIDVLKDASATAIYGSRGANGVILVTTEKGAKNRKPRINYSGYVGAQKVFAKYPMMNGPQFVALRKAAGQYQNGQDEADDVNTDWQDLFYQTGIVTDHNISLSGGTETGSYNFGGGYYNNQGVIPTQQYKRYALRGSIDQGVGKNFRFGFTTNTNYNQTEGGQVGLYNTLSMTPISSPYNADGSLRRGIRMIADNQYVYTKDVVENLRNNDQWVSEKRGFASYNALYGEVRIPGITGLKYRANLGLDYIQADSGSYTGAGVGDALNPNTASSASVDNKKTLHWTLENLLTYDRTFGKHAFNVVALYSVEQSKYNRSNMAGRDILSDDFQFYNIGQSTGLITVDPANQDYQLWGLKSAMGRVMYSYDNKYMISATVRSDASSRLAPGHKWHTYPAVSVGWNLVNESFIQDLDFFNSLKLRAGFGQTSNQAIAPYATLGKLDTRPYNFGSSSYSTGLYLSQLLNPNLGWEYSKTTNIGLDFSILKNRLSGTIEYYITKTEDILLGLDLPPTSGVTGFTTNIGSTENKGFELGLNGTILDNVNGFTWDAGVNFYMNKNKLTGLASGQTRDEANWWFVGHNINAIYDYERVGLWQKDDAYLNTLEPGGNIGMIKVKYTGGYKSDGTPERAIGPADRQIIDVDPDWQGGFNTRLAYKGFDLSVVGFYRHGGILYSTIHGASGYLNLLSGRRNNIDVDYWTPENTNAKYPKPGGIVSSDNPKYGTTLSYFDGSFMKIRTITLGYDFNHSLFKRSNIKLRMYATVQNPFVMFSAFHKESGLDPETNSYGNENVSSAGAISSNNNLLRRILTVGYNTPSTRNYILGANLTF
ncbi:SusC/RagA family protein [Niastella yeongjuensis]|uniref:SusC/RagA family protein n=1 Tax=Niastella yeongjuensis TaxID=354355 RepID=A0A1V9EPR6_9BACT|nr:TonB-dependent receptor [Niastella yeongjuensis]OQP48022.1 SusC/RagA family protein [Niastella yeongjuensis]SEO23863.1 TonB-linked outer membrane protein, SusC/RagA family [Niastella yeongjuensis]